ncbi:bacterial regulatory s, tetR family protein [Mycobacterium avium subsp. avium 2285 (R)]|nr:bacterial regulatory s, tetR family protein [Mycobacterium avium subsp. avium 2285 (R)]
MSSPSRWAGVPLKDRRAERRALLVEAAYRLFGSEGEAAVSVRSVCRECGLNTRYFYESFRDTDDLLGAVYDRVSEQLEEVIAAAIEQAGDSLRARTRPASRRCWASPRPIRAAAGCCSPMPAPTRCWQPGAAPPRTCCARGC